MAAESRRWWQWSQAYLPPANAVCKPPVRPPPATATHTGWVDAARKGVYPRETKCRQARERVGGGVGKAVVHRPRRHTMTFHPLCVRYEDALARRGKPYEAGALR